MDINDPVVPVRRSDLIEVLRHLNTLVLSLDRIGSCQQPNSDELFLDFCDDWDLGRRLLTCRSILSEYFSRELGVDDMDELERQMKDVPYWTLSNRTPPIE